MDSRQMVFYKCTSNQVRQMYQSGASKSFLKLLSWLSIF